MSSVSIDDAQARLPELIERLQPGETIVITRDKKPIARLTGEPTSAPPQPRRLGSLKGTVQYMAPDFDAPLDDFKESME